MLQTTLWTVHECLCFRLVLTVMEVCYTQSLLVQKLGQSARARVRVLCFLPVPQQAPSPCQPQCVKSQRLGLSHKRLLRMVLRQSVNKPLPFELHLCHLCRRF